MESAFVSVYQKERRSTAESSILSIYNLTADSFLQEGLRLFGDTGFADLRYRLEAIDLECEFLVAGFDESDNACCFVVEHPGIARRYTTVGYWAIGSGSQSALSSLSFHRYSWWTSGFPLCIYHVCEAKFMAETALGVGPLTIVVAWKSDGKFYFMRSEDVRRVRESWEASGRPKVPEGIEVMVDGLVKWEQMPQIKT